MPLATFLLDELVQLFKDAIRARVVDQAGKQVADTSEGSDYDLKGNAIGLTAHGLQGNALYIAKQVLPSTAEKEYLELHGAIRGRNRIKAAKAAGKVLLVMDESPASTADTLQGSGSVVTHADGRQYATTANATTAKPAWTGKIVGVGSSVQRIVVHPDVTGLAAGDVFDVAGVPRAIKEVLTGVNAIDIYVPLSTPPLPGMALSARRGVLAPILASKAEKAGNKQPGDTLTLAAPAGAAPNDIQPTAYIQELTGGGDDETDSELANGVRAFMTNRPGSGNPEDYRQWARETPGVRLGDAFVYPNYRGLGTVDVVLWGVEGMRMVGTSVVSAVQAYIGSKAHFADDVVVAAFAYKATPTAIVLQVAPKPGYEPDWPAPGTVPTVLVAPASSPTRVYLSATPSSLQIEIGDRVLVPLTVAGVARLVHARVTNTNSSSAPYFLDVEALPAAPASGVGIRPGGPLCDGVIAALDTLFDALGPGVASGGTTYARHPTLSGGAAYKLMPSLIIDALMEIAGVAHVAVTAPSSSGDTPAAQEILRLGAISLDHITL